jgi:DeoR family transcriptional regulator, fructose operon transcriptional repressor
VYAAERQQAIVDLITRRGRMSVTDLSQQFSVTTETVRRDLSALEGLRLVRRVHGGAIAADAITVLEVGLSDRDLEQTEQKDRIAAAAVGELPPGDATVLIDAGSTTVRLSELFPADRRLTVVTHSITVAHRLAAQPSIEVHMLPGRVRRTTLAAVGTETVAALHRIRADVAFMGTNGISVRHGLSTPDRTEADTKAAMIASAHRIVVVADSSKVGVERTVRFAELSEVDTLITDDAITDEDRSALEAAGMEVVIA